MVSCGCEFFSTQCLESTRLVLKADGQNVMRAEAGSANIMEQDFTNAATLPEMFNVDHFVSLLNPRTAMFASYNKERCMDGYYYRPFEFHFYFF
jgi:hypothetical protein